MRAELEEDFSPAPRLKHAALEDGRLMLARGAGFFCGLTSGGDRGNVGDFCIFLDRACVLSGGNLPLAQLPRPLSEPLPDWDFSDASRAIMGVDVSHAYAADAGVRAHQRTLMLSREEYGAQLVDVFDLAAPQPMRYAFHSPFAPEFFGGGARLGPMLLSWEAGPWPTPGGWKPAKASQTGSGSFCSPILRSGLGRCSRSSCATPDAAHFAFPKCGVEHAI